MTDYYYNFIDYYCQLDSFSCHLCSTFNMGVTLGQGTCPGISQIHKCPFLASPKLAGFVSVAFISCCICDLK